MATVHIGFDGGQVPIVTGDVPADAQTPIAHATATGYNSGLTALRRALLMPRAPADLSRMVAEGKLRRLVVIAVNARTEPRSPLDESRAYTSAVTVAEAISGTLVDSASAGSAIVFQNFITTLTEDRDRLVAAGEPGADFAVYPISIDFDQLPNATEAQRQEEQQVKSIATSWTLQPGDAALLDRVAGELLWRHPCFRALVADIGLRGHPEADPVPNISCPVEPPPLRRDAGSALLSASRGRAHAH
jgi:hypothetical protein